MKFSINKFLPMIVFLLLIAFLYLLLGCKSQSLEDAISKSIPYPVSSILHIEEIPDGAIVFYLSPKDDYHLMGVAFYKGNDERGWENIGPLDLGDYYAEQISLNGKTVDFYPEDPFNDRLIVIFGQINDPEIKKVKVGRANVEFVEANILESPEGRFYFKIGNYNIIQGLNTDGEVVLQIGQ